MPGISRALLRPPPAIFFPLAALPSFSKEAGA